MITKAGVSCFFYFSYSDVHSGTSVTFCSCLRRLFTFVYVIHLQNVVMVGNLLLQSCYKNKAYRNIEAQNRLNSRII